MREILDESPTMYIEAGETFEAHFNAKSGTGFSWVNDHQFETNSEQKVSFDDSYTVHDQDSANNWYTGEDNRGFRPRGGHGSQVSVFQSFSTKPKEDFTEEIKFVYARPWELRGEFPSDEKHLTMAEHTSIQVVTRSQIEHHFECFDFDLSSVLPK